MAGWGFFIPLVIDVYPIHKKRIALLIVSIGEAEEYSALDIYHKGFSCDGVIFFLP